MAEAPDAGASGAPRLLQVGRITKAHGLRGEVVVVLTSDRDERVAAGSVLDTDRGPLTVVASRPHQDRWIVSFRGVDRREHAEQLRGIELRAEPLEDPDVLWVHEVVGCKVRTVDGVERGRVEAVMDNPAADLLVLDTGALVPVVFIESGPDEGVIVVDTPDGLFELAE